MISNVAGLVLDSVQFLSHRVSEAETYILDGSDSKVGRNLFKA